MQLSYGRIGAHYSKHRSFAPRDAHEKNGDVSVVDDRFGVAPQDRVF